MAVNIKKGMLYRKAPPYVRIASKLKVNVIFANHETF